MHLRSGTAYAQLAGGLQIGTRTVYRYVREAADLLSALAPPLAEAVRAASRKACVLLDGTLLPIDRIAADRPFYSGKHKKHGMNVQVIADPASRLLWASPALPGAVHDIRAAREHGILAMLDSAGVTCWADKGYQGAGSAVRVHYRGCWEGLSVGQQAVNRSDAARIVVPVGWLRLRATRRNLDAACEADLASDDGAETTEQLRVRVWPAEPARTELIKLWQPS